MLYFYTDYMEGAHPEVMRRLTETNLEHTTGYGSDQYTQRAKQLIREACGQPEAAVHFLVGGTQTNATVIDALRRSTGCRKRTYQRSRIRSNRGYRT